MRHNKEAVIIVLAFSIIAMLCACSNMDNFDNKESREKYELSNGYTPSEVQDIISDAILKIYMPGDEDDIKDGVNKLAPISTEAEINELLNTVGKFDSENRATIKNLHISIAMPENTTNKRLQYLVTFNMTTAASEELDMMIQFNCDDKGMIKSHSIWSH